MTKWKRAVLAAAIGMVISEASLANTCVTADGTTANTDTADYLCFAQGLGATAGRQSMAVGINANASGSASVAFGYNAYADQQSASAFGWSARAGAYSEAIGANAKANAVYSVAIGPDTIVPAGYVGGVVIGANSTLTKGGLTNYQPYLQAGTATAYSTFSVGSPSNRRIIENVAPGRDDNDVVTVSQLKAAKALIDGNTSSITAMSSGQALNVHYTDSSQTTITLGTGAGAPTKISGVGAGVADTDAANVAQFKAAVQLAVGAQDTVDQLSSVAVTYSDAGHNTVTFGTAGNSVKLAGVAPGVDATDAVNVAQLQAVAAQAATGNPLGIAYADSGKGAVFFGGMTGTTLQNVASGVADTDAVNVAQLNDVKANVSASAAALGGGSLVGAGGFIPPAYTISGNVYRDVGAAFSAVDSQLASLDTRIGEAGNGGQSYDAAIRALSGRVDLLEKNGASPGSTTGVAVGGSNSQGGNSASVAQGSNGVAVGGQAAAGGQNATAIGGESYAAGPGDTAIGGGAKVNADYSTAVGSSAHVAAVATHSVALGANSEVTQDHAVAVGEGSQANAKNSVALGAGSVAARENTVSVGAVGSERAISNVADGTSATDAATVGQVDASTQKAIDTAQGYTDKRFADLQTGIDRFAGAVNDRFQAVDRRVNGTGAMATAMSQMGTASAGASGNGRIAAGVGFQGGERAISVGYATPIGERMHLNFGGAATATQRTVGAGIGVDL